MELEIIQNRIYEIRGYRVMLDFDLAEMYQVETKRIKEQVRRNIDRFPLDFMFELSPSEWTNLRSQIATSSWGGARYQPFAFTEQGVAMLSSVLKSDIAIKVNISIMRAFVVIRNSMIMQISVSKEIEELWKTINDLSEDNRKKMDDIYLAIAELSTKQKVLNEKEDLTRKPIGYQHYK